MGSIGNRGSMAIWMARPKEQGEAQIPALSTISLIPRISCHRIPFGKHNPMTGLFG